MLGVVAVETLDVVMAILGDVDVMSSRETDDDTAEFAGVLKCFEANLTFQNCS
jgi:hypothetical protein